MKFFQLFRKKLVALGIEPHQPLQKNHFMFVLLRRLLIFSLFVLWIIFSTVFLIYEAKKLGEYSDSAYISISLICYVLMLATTAWKLEKLFKLFESFEDLIKKRKIFLLFFCLTHFILRCKRILGQILSVMKVKSYYCSSIQCP